MTGDRYRIKYTAKMIIRSSRPSPITAAVIYSFVSIVISMLGNSALSVNVTQELAARYLELYVDALLGASFEPLLPLLEEMAPPVSAYFVDLALHAVLMIVGAGFVIFVFNTVRRSGAVLGNLLDGFGIALKLLLLTLLRGGIVLVLSLFLVVPGVIAAYSYSMALYILIDDPGKRVVDCMRESRKMMQGHRMEFFRLQFSFFGWYMLTVIPYVGYGALVWVLPYTETSYVLYYLTLAGRSSAVEAPAQEG